jgi:hypothetical protein
VPSIMQINKKVPAELERIVNHALARDPAQRYQTARDLGLELTRFMFKFGVPVSTFEIGQLVQGAMKERQRQRPLQPSIIDKLIEEALFEFTSLTDDKGAPAGQAKPASPSGTQRASAPAASGYVDVGSWIDEIAGGSKAGDAALRAAMPPGVMEGNLAALEDEPERASESPAVMAAKAHSSSDSSIPPSSGRQRMSPTPSAPPLVAPELEARSGGTKIGVVVALLVVVAAGAAAWFTHLIPHP